MRKNILPRLRVSSLLLSGLWLASAVVAPAAPAPVEGSQVKFQLARPGFVTVAIDDAGGKRVRNLIGGEKLEAGPQSVPWDGLDDAGEPLPPGNYHWKGLVHDGVTSEFEGAFNSPGNPPWKTAEIGGQYYVRPSGAGGWLSDHGVPGCAYSDGEHIYFGSSIAEAGHSMMELDPEGQKIWGTLWLGLSGANAIYKKDDTLYVAGEKGWMKTSLAVHRLNAETHKLLSNPKERKLPKTETAFIKVKMDDFSGIQGMVVTDHYVILSLSDKNRLALFDGESGEFIRDVPLPEAGAIAQPEGDSLLAISGEKVIRLNFEDGSSRSVIETGLEEPAGLAVSSRGNILVSDVAESEQRVKVFSPAGALLNTIGKPGGHREGAFDREALNEPRALAVDAKDQVWIGESSYLPKRISVWTMEGKLLNGWTGPPGYGGGGTLNPKDATIGYYNGMQFAVAPWPDASQLQAILFDPENHQDLPSPHKNKIYSGLPEAPVYRGNQLYLMYDQGYGVRHILIGEVVDDHLLPRAIFGSWKNLREAWKDLHPEFIESLPADLPENQGVFLWQDVNGDGKADPTEVQIQPDWKFGAMWAMRSWPTLNFYARSADGTEVIVVSPGANPDKLVYDLAAAQSLPLPTEVAKHGVIASSPDMEGNLLVNAGTRQGDPTNKYYSIAPDGQINWSYPNPFPANWHNSPRLKPGDIQHTLNVEGIVPLGGDRGSVFQLNGNKGVRFLLTTDGLYVARLFGDMRQAPLLSSVTKVSRGLRLDTYSLEDECFHGWFGRAGEEGIYQVLGKDSSNVLKVHGLESIQRLPGGELSLSQAAQKALVSNLPRPPITGVQIGGIGQGWPDVEKRPLLDGHPSATLAIGYTPGSMTLVVTVKDTTPFANAGEDPKTLFKTGNAVDFRISTAEGADPSRTAPVPGDQRFIFSTLGGKPVAVRYRFVVPGTGPDAKSTFTSPTGTAEVDDVSIVEKAKVEIKELPDGWQLTASLAWKDLGLDKAPERDLQGDVGILLSDPEGTRTVARHYYFSQGDQIVSDLPGEVRVDPSQWGKISF